MNEEAMQGLIGTASAIGTQLLIEWIRPRLEGRPKVQTAALAATLSGLAAAAAAVAMEIDPAMTGGYAALAVGGVATILKNTGRHFAAKREGDDVPRMRHPLATTSAEASLAAEFIQDGRTRAAKVAKAVFKRAYDRWTPITGDVARAARYLQAESDPKQKIWRLAVIALRQVSYGGVEEAGATIGSGRPARPRRPPKAPSAPSPAIIPTSQPVSDDRSGEGTDA